MAESNTGSTMAGSEVSVAGARGRRRLAPRFSLRALVIVTTVASLWIGYASLRARRQRLAVQALVAEGVQIQYEHAIAADRSAYPIRRVPREEIAAAGPAWLRGLVGDDYFVAPFALWFSKDRPRYEDDLSSLAGFSDLGEVHDVRLGDEGLPQLLRHRRLRALALDPRSPIDDFAFIARLPQLMHLSVSGTSFGDADMVHLRRLKNLWWFQARRTGLTDEGVAQLAGQRQLRLLDLSNTKITDRSLSIVAALPNLQTVYLSNTAVTDAGLQRLDAMPDLRAIILTGANVTDEAVAKLMRVHPRAWVLNGVPSAGEADGPTP